MKRIYYFFCALIMAATTLTSCDKEADNVKMVRVSGTYNGNIEANLYMPEWDAEKMNEILNDDGSPSLASCVVKNGQLEVNFASDDMAHFTMKNLAGMAFKVPFLDYEEDADIVYVRSSFAGGTLNSMFSIVENHYDSATPAGDPMNHKMSKAEFYKLVKMMEYIQDEISFENVRIQPVLMRELGANYCSYDEEQNSFYVRAKLEEMSYVRKTNLTDIANYIETSLLTYFTAEEKAAFQNFKSKIKLTGTISDAEGWCNISYSNYSPYIDLTIDKATGLIDVLSMALYGPYKTDYEGKVVKDKDGNPVKMPTLCLEIEYQGTINNLNSYEKVED